MSPTRREFVLWSGFTALGSLLVRAPLAGFQAAQQPAPTFTPLRRNVGIFTMRGGTVGYLINQDSLVVVDSQFPAEARLLAAGLAERSGGRRVDALVNTHHHGDHTAGNVAFRGAVGRVVAHEKAAEHMRNPPGGQPPEDALFPDTTFSMSWEADAGDERVMARWYGRAHTSGDAVITFERANVVHLGDLMFHLRHPVVDRPAGATLKGWHSVLASVLAEHSSDTLYIFGHAGPNRPVTGSRVEVEAFRNYLEGLLAFVERQIRAGKNRDEILSMREPLPGFEAYGPFGQPGPRDPLTCAYEEITSS